MGKRNRQRRADKKRREQRRTNSSSFRSSGDQVPDLRALVMAGGQLAAQGCHDELDVVVGLLSEAATCAGRANVGVALAGVVSSVLAHIWESGWQPAELVRAVRRRGSSRHADLVVTALAADEGWRGPHQPERWTAQIEALGAWRWWGDGPDWVEPHAKRSSSGWTEVVRVGLESLGVVMTLPVIEPLMAPPSTWDAPVSDRPGQTADDPVLAKIRGLLAKAESTSFTPEAEALTAKAQELMARHAIDEAVARSGDGARRAEPGARRIAVDDPYADAKAFLLHAVAEANAVRSIWYEGLAMMAVVGFETDLDAVEMLFTSLLVQSTRAMLAKGSVTDERGRSRTRSFRQSFLLAFASRIGERLALASREATDQAEQDLGTSLVPVLALRSEEVDDAVSAMFPKLSKVRGPSVTNDAGWIAGRSAAELATLGAEERILAGAR